MRGIFRPGPVLGIFVLMLVSICGTCQPAYAQTAECPSARGCVTITREAAERALADSDRVKALEAENKVIKQAVDDEKAVSAKLKIDFANVSGENSGLKQAAVRSDAIIDLLLKSVRKKCMPLSLCVN